MDLMQLPVLAFDVVALLWIFPLALLTWFLSVLVLALKPASARPGTSWPPSQHHRRLAMSRGLRPAGYALGLAALAVPLVAYAATVHDPSRGEVPVDDGRRFLLGLLAGGLSAAVAGFVGGLAVRRHFLAGVGLTYFLAQTVAVVGAAVFATLVRPAVDVGFVCMALNGCNPVIRAVSPGDWIWLLPAAVLGAGAVPFVEPGPCLILLVGVLLWAVLVRRDLTREG